MDILLLDIDDAEDETCWFKFRKTLMGIRSEAVTARVSEEWMRRSWDLSVALVELFFIKAPRRELTMRFISRMGMLYIAYHIPAHETDG